MIDAKSFTQALLDWYRQHGRSLPWRLQCIPYRVWLSEVMLQQTGVKTVLPYYQTFLENFSDIETLASAPVDEVIALWAGLGYYSRARNLHAAAVQVCEQHGGEFPDGLVDLMALPGIGRSTAGAILAIAFKRKGVILDGNVRRVLCRLYALQADPRSRESEQVLWQWADQLTPADDAHDYAQAIMDLGATVCTPRQPICEQCPVSFCCAAREQGVQHQLPQKRSKKTVPVRQEIVVVARSQQGFAVRQRPLQGMLAGLWEFPTRQFTDPLTVEQLHAEAVGLSTAEDIVELGKIRHIYSHFKAELHIYSHTSALQSSGAYSTFEWVSFEKLSQLPFHGSHKKIIQNLLTD
ncbi:MAG: A/G-specific adenine glycosylase [Deltaproteobacteria bacterium]|nr:A/G-specific adenine glycosylase [Deltaproteobacteria bacterium]